jgi:hypothetical protein
MVLSFGSERFRHVVVEFGFTWAMHVPPVFFGSVSKERGCGPQCAEVFENKWDG